MNHSLVRMLEHKCVNELLSAFDRVANSNSLLLVGKITGDLKADFECFVSSLEFREQIFHLDLLRDWHNYHDIDDFGTWQPRPGEFYNGQAIEYLEETSGRELATKLKLLLQKGPSFYDRQLEPAEAETIVDEFCESLLSANSTVINVKPDFLYGRDPANETDHLPENCLPYFEGWGADHCYAWEHEGQLLVLLLNGCP